MLRLYMQGLQRVDALMPLNMPEHGLILLNVSEYA